MPSKTCPQCSTVHGARKLVCDCGHNFECKRTGKEAMKSGDAPLYPEPGTWVLDKMKKMPDINPPEDLPRGPVDVEVVKQNVLYEGLGFAIYSLIPAERISDPQLQKLWREARAAMQKIIEYLEKVDYYSPNQTD